MSMARLVQCERDGAVRAKKPSFFISFQSFRPRLLLGYGYEGLLEQGREKGAMRDREISSLLSSETVLVGLPPGWHMSYGSTLGSRCVSQSVVKGRGKKR
jgi:hypothetical protein